MNIKEMSSSELRSLLQAVEYEMELRTKKLAVVAEILERVKGMGLEVSDLLGHMRMKKKRSPRVKGLR